MFLNIFLVKLDLGIRIVSINKGVFVAVEVKIYLVLHQKRHVVIHNLGYVMVVLAKK